MSEERLKMSTRLRPKPTLGARSYYYYNFFLRASNAAGSAEKKKNVSLPFWTSEAIDILFYSASTGLWNQRGHSLRV